MLKTNVVLKKVNVLHNTLPDILHFTLTEIPLGLFQPERRLKPAAAAWVPESRR